MSIFDYPDDTSFKISTLQEENTTSQKKVIIKYNKQPPNNMFKFYKNTFDYQSMFLDCGNTQKNDGSQDWITNKINSSVGKSFKRQDIIQRRQRPQNMVQTIKQKKIRQKKSNYLQQLPLQQKQIEQIDMKPIKQSNIKCQLPQMNFIVVPFIPDKNQSMFEDPHMKSQQSDLISEEVDQQTSNSQIDDFTLNYGTISKNQGHKIQISRQFASIQTEKQYKQKDQSDQSVQIEQQNKSGHELLQILQEIQIQSIKQKMKEQEIQKQEIKAIRIEKLKRLDSVDFWPVQLVLNSENCSKIVIKTVTDFDGTIIKTKNLPSHIKIDRKYQIKVALAKENIWKLGEVKCKIDLYQVKLECFNCRFLSKPGHKNHHENTYIMLCSNRQCTKQIFVQFKINFRPITN